MPNFKCLTADDLLIIGKNFATTLKKSSIIVLNGVMGAGKTHFIKGSISSFGIDKNLVASPTFSLVNIYNTTRFNIAHFDLYRLGNAEEFELIGGLDYLKDHLCFIEWANLILDELPKPYYNINISIDNDSSRFVEIMEVL